MKIHFIIVNSTINLSQNITEDSISKALHSYENITYSIGQINANSRQEEAKALNNYLKNEKIDCDYICLIPQLSVVSPDLGEFIKSYILDKPIEDAEETLVFLPLVELVAEGDEKISKGFLNTCPWKSYMHPEEVGILDNKLANAQVDTTLYGALIPIDVFTKIEINETLKFFYHFNLINQFTAQEIRIVGIQKAFLLLVHDYELKGENEAEKREDFNNAKSIECVKIK